MKKSLITFAGILLIHLISFSRSPAQVRSVEVVKTLNGYVDEARYYYKNNWEKFRVEAQKRGFISSYEILFSEIDSAGDREILLITIYSDKEQYSNAEKNFREIIDSMVGPKGPKYLNDRKPADFRKRIYLNEFFVDKD